LEQLKTYTTVLTLIATETPKNSRPPESLSEAIQAITSIWAEAQLFEWQASSGDSKLSRLMWSDLLPNKKASSKVPISERARQSYVHYNVMPTVWPILTVIATSAIFEMIKTQMAYVNDLRLVEKAS
jgi:hypothetical protein